MTTKNLTWKQLQNEPDFEYQAFKHYLHYGPARSYRQTALFYSRSKRTIVNWAKKWNWAERFKSYKHWVCYKAASLTMDFIRTLEKEKYEFKINQSGLSPHIAKILQRHFEKYETFDKDKQFYVQLKFLELMAMTINVLFESHVYSTFVGLQNYFKTVLKCFSCPFISLTLNSLMLKFKERK